MVDYEKQFQKKKRRKPRLKVLWAEGTRLEWMEDTFNSSVIQVGHT